ncbi:uncharacterized protein LOC129802993 [Phlebotomus papatasi]|uniref:uncharacterized protein LOC129800711 n=1 Tax=Phlebotomus papatasi TaxID=29031 RepID=UPI002483418B|nr:uncharacterized protein LOC129800711 [Phlebotomus papatasi]XP_055705247.1 uncharacterized protein LOC129802993 [Phlebotomus papatasi]
MFTCIECKIPFDTPEMYINHIKNDHLYLSRYFTLRCTASDCSQEFNELYKLKKHLFTHMKKESRNDSYNVDQIQENVQKRKDQKIMESNDLAQIDNYSETDVNNVMQYQTNHVNVECQLETRTDTPTAPTDSNAVDIKKSLISFSLSLHKNPHMPRKTVVQIQNDITNLITVPINNMLQKFLPVFENHSSIKLDFMNILSILNDPFKSIKTDYKLLRHLNDLDIFQYPNTKVVHVELADIIKNNAPVLDENTVEYSLVDINFQMKKFFESDNIFEYTLKNMRELMSNQSNVSHFVNGELWKEKTKLYGDKIMIPYFLYSDGFELNDPLSSHAGIHSVCGIYYSFPVIPDFLVSKLKNIFVAGFIKHRDLNEYGINKMLRGLVEILVKIEQEGTTITANNTTYHVHFVLGQILGDNLGLNQILGYTTAFNANHFCRMCIRNKSQTQHDCMEYKEWIRTKENYNSHLQIQNTTDTGIVCKSVFNDIPSFHVVENIACDLMHDMYAGVCRYDLAKILNYFIYEKKFFSLDTLNYRKQMFNCGKSEIANVSPPIERHHIQNGKFKMTSAEMKMFMHFILLMIGDLIPENDRVYQFLVTLIKILDIALLPSFTEEKIDELEGLIAKHNREYTKLFCDTLKPKHHNLCHYPRIIRRCGPLKFLWCFRYEAVHQQYKTYARNITSRVNICHTLCIKNNLFFANHLVAQDFFNHKIEFGDGIPTDVTAKPYYEALKGSLSSILNTHKNVCYKGNTYEIGFYCGIQNSRDIFEIIEIFSIDKKCFCICTKWKTTFCNKFQSHEVEKTTENIVIDVDEISTFPLHVYMLNNYKKYIRIKY